MLRAERQRADHCLPMPKCGQPFVTYRTYPRLAEISLAADIDCNVPIGLRKMRRPFRSHASTIVDEKRQRLAADLALWRGGVVPANWR